MILIGVILAGLVMLVGPLPGLVKAMTSGVIIGKGYGSPRISREEDPARFKRLLGQRFATLVPGAALFFGGLAWLLLNVFAAAMPGAAQ